jgi:vancomycin permeability regulator SanA
MKLAVVSIFPLLIGLFLYPIIKIYSTYQAQIYSISDISHEPIAIVFGAALKKGKPTEALKQRLYAAIDLYRAGKVKRLLFSGDGESIYYNEPVAMRNMAVALGIPKDAIVLDPLGLNTHATCQRARQIYHLDKAVLVTQGYHLPRALYSCTHSGLKVVGLSAKRWLGPSFLFALFREACALNLIWWRELLGFAEFNSNKAAW